MKAALAWWLAGLLVLTTALSLIPGLPSHGYGQLWFALPLLFWFRNPAQRRRLLLYALGVLVLLLAYPAPDFGFLGWVVLWPYLWARCRPDGACWWRSAFLFGFLRAHAGYHWLGQIHFTAWIGVSVASAILFVVCFEAVLRHARFLPFALRGATGWVLFEWAHSWFLGGFPWLYLAHSQYRYLAVIQVADLIGAYGISFLVAYVSLALWRWRQRSKSELAVAALFLAATLGYGLMRRAPARDFGPGVLMIQPAVPMSVKEEGEAAYEQILDTLLRLSEQGLAQHPDSELVVWPETMHPIPYVEELDPARSRFHRSVRQIAARLRRPIICGVSSYTSMERFRRRRGHNAAVLVDRDGRIAGLYRKQRLVSMGEKFLPRMLFSEARCDLWKRWLVRHLGYPASSDLEEGEGYVTMRAGPGLACAMLICFEGLYADMARQALAEGKPDLILHLVNNGWFADSWEERQSLASWVFRAIETRTPFLSCANGGISCVIGPRGAIQAALPRVMEEGFLYARVPGRWSPPLFLRGGAWILPAGLALAVLLYGLLGLRKRRRTI